MHAAACRLRSPRPLLFSASSLASRVSGFATASKTKTPADGPQGKSASGGNKPGSDGSQSGVAQDKGRRARIDIRRIIANAEASKANAANRGVAVDVDALARAHDQYQSEHRRLNGLRSERNAVAKEMTTVGNNAERRAELVTRGKAIKEEIASLQDAFAATEAHMLELALAVPNESSPHSPIGDESKAAVVFETPVSERPVVEGEPRDHVQLGHLLGIIDTESAARASGSGFYYLKGAGALLEHALVGYALHAAAARGFVPVMTPDIARISVAEGCGYQPREGGSANQTFTLSGGYSNLCLVGTAEIPIAGMHVSQWMDEAELPRKYVGVSHCFRAEAGHYGADTRGIYRVHQFTKVELFAFTRGTVAESEQALAEIVALQTHLFTSLGLPIRVLEMPTMELGASAYRKIDIEAWMPGRKKYGEISSASNCTDFQSRRLEIRQRSKEHHVPGHYPGEDPSDAPAVPFVHTVNGTAAAIPRLIVAILENFQHPDGSVIIPAPLRPYMGGRVAIFAPEIEAAASGRVGDHVEI